jgi:hypothetical protein
LVPAPSKHLASLQVVRNDPNARFSRRRALPDYSKLRPDSGAFFWAGDLLDRAAEDTAKAPI